MTTPQQYATRRRELAQDYDSKMKELGQIKSRKALKMIALVEEHGSVSKASLYWDATEDGQKEIEISFYTKGLLELMRAVKTEVDILQSEAFNQY